MNAQGKCHVGIHPVASQLACTADLPVPDRAETPVAIVDDEQSVRIALKLIINSCAEELEAVKSWGHIFIIDICGRVVDPPRQWLVRYEFNGPEGGIM
jgi:hypothetical protein